jgi:hypothetical protein
MEDPVRCTPRRGGELSFREIKRDSVGISSSSVLSSSSFLSTSNETIRLLSSFLPKKRDEDPSLREGNRGGGAAMDDMDRWIPAAPPRQKLPSLREGKRGGAMDDLERSTPRPKLSSSSSNLEGRLGGAAFDLVVCRPLSMLLLGCHLLQPHFAERTMSMSSASRI